MMATTQLPIEGVFDEDTGKLLGIVALSGAEVSLAASSPFGLPVKLMLAGASQYSRCSTEVQVATAQITDEVLYITHNTPFLYGIVTGAEAFCAVAGHFVFGNVTVTSDTTLTMPAIGMANTVANTSGTQFLHFTGFDAGASWIGHLKSRYGAGLQYVGNISQHGANVSEVETRIPAILSAIALKRPDIVVFEPGWGNSFFQDATWDSVMPKARENLKKICDAAPKVILATLPPIAPGGASALAIDNYHRMNAWLRSADVLLEFPNVIIVDSTTALQDFTRTDGGSIAGVHSDTLHWTPLGAYILANSCYAPVFDKLMPVLPVARGGASHVWVNGNRQLYDGLLDNTGYTPAVSGITSSGTLDNTMTIAKQGGGSVAVAFSKTTRTNGLYKQVAAITNMGGTTVMTLRVPGATGNLLKDRVQAGKKYRLVVRMAITSVTGNISAVDVLAQATLTGHAGTTTRLVWAGRTQEGFVEGGSTNFPQTATEPARDYYGKEFTMPAGMAVTDFAIGIVVRSGGTGSGLSFEIEDITLLDITE
jgi:hypothetical protein